MLMYNQNFDTLRDFLAFRICFHDKESAISVLVHRIQIHEIKSKLINHGAVWYINRTDPLQTGSWMVNLLEPLRHWHLHLAVKKYYWYTNNDLNNWHTSQVILNYPLQRFCFLSKTGTAIDQDYRPDPQGINPFTMKLFDKNNFCPLQAITINLVCQLCSKELHGMLLLIEICRCRIRPVRLLMSLTRQTSSKVLF